jgi:hypothetical protein
LGDIQDVTGEIGVRVCSASSIANIAYWSNQIHSYMHASSSTFHVILVLFNSSSDIFRFFGEHIQIGSQNFIEIASLFFSSNSGIYFGNLFRFLASLN